MANSLSPLWKNQFGQVLQRGTIVGHVNKTGSYTERKVGVITSFAERKSYGSEPNIVARVTWLRHNSGPTTIKSPGVAISNLFALDERNVDRAIINEAIDAL